MEIKILEKAAPMDEVKDLAKAWYGMMIKGCVDIMRRRVALGGDYHIESCEKLVEDGSKHTDVWGFNIRFEEQPFIEFDSLVNIKPALGNKTRAVDDSEIAKVGEEIIRQFVIF